MRTAAPALSPVDFWTGIVGDVYAVPRVPGDPSVFVSVSRIADFTALGLPAAATNAGSGAGLSHEAARNAAVGESVERYAAAVPMTSEVVLATSRELTERGMRHTRPSEWTLMDQAEIRTRTALDPFDEDAPVAWVQGDNLVRRESEWVPACVVNMPYTRVSDQERPESVVDSATSTGLACAQTRRKAMVAALCEIIERDAFVITWRDRLPAPRLLLDPQSPAGRTFTRHFDRPGLDYHLFCTTLDLLVPSFFGYVVDRRCDPPAVVAGGAAHPDPDVAVVKTLTELAQALAWVHNPGRSRLPTVDDFDSITTFDDHMRLYADNAPLDAFDFLAQSATIDEAEVRGRFGTDEDLQTLVERFADRQIDLVAVDLTSCDVAECGLAVVKVVAPQCEVLDAVHRLPHITGRRWRRYLEEGQAVNPYPHPYP
jgi:ribosomal protein S12 methylthiotransferase accessory factor